MKLELAVRPVDDLVPYHRNAKDHGEGDIEAIAKSISKFGFNDPIAITPEGVIIEGHGRLAAAKRLGLEQVPVLVISGLTEEQIDLYRIAHNKIALVSQFDFNKLYSLLTDITGLSDIEATDMGFTELGYQTLQMHFGTRQQSTGESSAAASKAIEYDVIWENKEERERMASFLKDLQADTGNTETPSGDMLLAKIKKDDPQLYAQLVAAVPGVTDLDLEAAEQETVSVRS